MVVTVAFLTISLTSSISRLDVPGVVVGASITSLAILKTLVCLENVTGNTTVHNTTSTLSKNSSNHGDDLRTLLTKSLNSDTFNLELFKNPPFHSEPRFFLLSHRKSSVSRKLLITRTKRYYQFLVSS